MADKSGTPQNEPIMTSNQIPMPQGATSSGMVNQQIMYQPPQYYQEGYANEPTTTVTTVTATRTSNATGELANQALEEDEIYGLTPHVKMSFADTFAESESSQGFPFMPKVNELIYTWTHFAVYGSLSMIISPIMSAIWAIFFACYHLFIVWMIQPMIKSFFLVMRLNEMLIRATVRTFTDPIFRSMALMLSSIRGLFQLTDSNINLNLKTTQAQDV